MPPKILMFSKEFNRGEAVSEFIASFCGRIREKAAVDLVCYHPNYSAEGLFDGRLSVYKVPFVLNADTYFNWVILMNNELKSKGRELAEGTDYFLVIANDWTSYPAASAVATLFNIPLVTIFHSTEHNRGFSYENSRPISDIEWEACFASRRVVATSADCRNSLAYDLKIPAEKILDVEGLIGFLDLLEEVSIHSK